MGWKLGGWVGGLGGGGGGTVLVLHDCGTLDTFSSAYDVKTLRSSGDASVTHFYTLLFSRRPSGNETAVNMENVADVTRSQPALSVLRGAEHIWQYLH